VAISTAVVQHGQHATAPSATNRALNCTNPSEQTIAIACNLPGCCCWATAVATACYTTTPGSLGGSKHPCTRAARHTIQTPHSACRPHQTPWL